MSHPPVVCEHADTKNMALRPAMQKKHGCGLSVRNDGAQISEYAELTISSLRSIPDRSALFARFQDTFPKLSGA